jgi:cellulose synthase/poly-beta-1,6-N-acetylglucosamine synthase-like glycosyltransferase
VEDLRVLLPLTLVVLVVVLAAFAAASFDALLKGCFELRRILRSTSYDFDSLLLKSPLVPGISVVFAPRDASPESRALARRLLDLHFGRHELVLVLDALPPAALDRWIADFHLVRRERVVPEDLPTEAIRGYYVSQDPLRLLAIDKQPGGVADAFNAGVNAAQYSVIGLVDAGAEFIPEVLLRLIRPMLGDWDGTVAVCAVAPPPPVPGLVGSIGALEWRRLWLARCGAFSAWQRLLPVPGAFLVVKRDAVRAVGGFRAGPLELFLDLHAAARTNGLRWRTAFVASPVSFRLAARSWRDLHRQVRDDQRQLGSALQPLRPGPGREFFGLFCARGLRPLLETAAYALAAAGWITGLVPTALVALVPVIAIGGAIVTSMAAVVLGELAQSSSMAPSSLAILFLAAIPENLGYRQIRNLWLIAGYFGAPAPKKRKRGHPVKNRAPAIETSQKR